MLNIHMHNTLLYCGIKYRIPCSYSSLYLSIFLSITTKFLSQFSPELCKPESSNMVYICRMSDYIVGLRFRIMALISLFLSIFLSFPILRVNIQDLCQSFSGTFKARMLKLGIHMDGFRIEPLALILPFSYPVFFVFVFRLLRICGTGFFATYLLLLIYSSALLKQCSGAIVRFSDISSFEQSCSHIKTVLVLTGELFAYF